MQEAADAAKALNMPLVLVNGEVSTDVAQYFGIAACCLTTGGEHTIKPELLKELKAAYAGEIIVALDCDSAGRENAAKVVKQLVEAGFDAQAVDLGFSSGGEDISDFCKL